MVKLLTRFALTLLALGALLPASAAHADDSPHAQSLNDNVRRIVRSESWEEEWDPSARRWVRLAHPLSITAPMSAASSPARPIGIFGPFVVLNSTTAALIGTTDNQSPANFARMRAAFPDIAMLQLIDAPGTVQDVANLELGRMIRAAGVSTHVPSNGSVRSGAVELFLAGKTRTMEPGARFAVHSWRDQRGRGPQDYSPDDPVNRLYTSYYEHIGMSARDARAFYDMTNSVPHSSALWFGPEEMNRWIAKLETIEEHSAPAVRLTFDQNLMFKPFAPIDDYPFIPTRHFARSLQVPLAGFEVRWALAEI